MADERKYQGNSLSAIRHPGDIQKRDAPRDAKPVANGREKKPPLSRRVAESLMSVSADDLMDRIVFRWVLPGIGDMLQDLIRVIFGGTKNDGIVRTGGENRISTVLHSSWDSNHGNGISTMQNKPRTRNPQIYVSSEQEANDILRELQSIYNDYHRVTMKQLYQAAGLPTDWAMSEWGWYDVSGIRAIPGSSGQWIVEAPKAEVME